MSISSTVCMVNNSLHPSACFLISCLAAIRKPALCASHYFTRTSISLYTNMVTGCDYIKPLSDKTVYQTVSVWFWYLTDSLRLCKEHDFAAPGFISVGYTTYSFVFWIIENKDLFLTLFKTHTVKKWFWVIRFCSPVAELNRWLGT